MREREQPSTVAIALALGLIPIAFSTDLRVGLNFELGSNPDFQLFEIGALLVGAAFCLGLPRWLLAPRLPFRREDAYLIAFIAWAAATAPLALDPLHSISRAKDFLVAGFLYGVIRYSPIRERTVGYVVAITVGISTFWSLVGIWQWLGLDSDFGGQAYRLFLASNAQYKTSIDFAEDDVIASTYAHGLYLYPQNFAYYLIVPLSLGLGLAVRRPWLWFVPAVAVIAIVGTASKTLFVLAALIGLFSVIRFFMKNAWVAALLTLLIAVIAALAILDFGNIALWRKVLATFDWRINIWSDAIDMLLDRPSVALVGHGTEWLRDRYSRVGYPNPHNVLFYFLIEYGFIGLSFFALFIYSLFRRALRFADDTADDRSPCVRMGRNILFGLLLFLCMGLGDDIFVQTQLTGLFVFYAAIMMKLFELRGSQLARASSP